MQFQAQQQTDHWPEQGSALNTLINGIGPNAEAIWNGGNPRPAGMPPNAVRALLSRFYHTERWNSPCRGSCWVEEGTVYLSIYFSDGSLYFYSFQWSYMECTIGGHTEKSRTRSILDTAGLHGEPSNDHVIRSDFLQVLHQDSSSRERTFALRGPTGGTIRPPDNLSQLVDPRARVEFRVGPGGTLDLTGHTTPLFSSSLAPRLYADNILLDPGVNLGQLFTIAPEVHSAEAICDFRMTWARYPILFGPGFDHLSLRFINLGTDPVSVPVNWHDTDNWIVPGSGQVDLMPGESLQMDIPVLTPPAPMICERDACTIEAWPCGQPAPSTLTLDLWGDADFDGDFVKDSVDSCPLVFNPSQGDTDGDWRGNACDNCIFLFNVFQDDADQNGQGDACDPPCVADVDDGQDTGLPDGGVGIEDLLYYLGRFDAGC
jgi:hypothetical protein